MEKIATDPQGSLMDIGPENKEHLDIPSGDAGQTIDSNALSGALRRLDLILLPAVTLLYFLSFLDRANLGNARVSGLQQDLRLTNNQYSICLTVTYIPYIVAELPLSLLMKPIGAQRLLPALCVAWGLVTTFQGFVKDYPGLLVARFFLGACEGAILPGSVAYMSTFYRRTDLGTRFAFYFSAVSLAGAFSGLLAAAIIQLDGKGGQAGWRWIFFLEGAFTVVCGVLVYFVLPANVKTARFLSEPQREALTLALVQDGRSNEDEERFSWSEVWSAFKAPHVIFMSILLFGCGTNLYALAYFAPSIVQGLGYTGTSTQLMSVPPYGAALVISILLTFLSDRLRQRGAFIVLMTVTMLTGYAMFLGSSQDSVRYGSLFLQVTGSFTLAALTSTWQSNNLSPFYRRTTGIVIGFVTTNCGGILSTWLFPGAEGPRYKRGTSVLLGISVVMLLATAANLMYLHGMNKRRGKFVDEDASMLQSGEDERTRGDRSVTYRYML